MKMDQHHDYSIDEHNACRIETPPARISSPRPCSVLARTVVPLRSEPGVKFDYEMAMGVRYGEREWKQQIDRLYTSRRPLGDQWDTGTPFPFPLY